MSNPISISNLTLNPKEVEDVKAFIKELTLNAPELSFLNTVIDGVTMKQQAVLVKLTNLAGQKAGDTCARVESDAIANLVQKYYEPQEIEYFTEICSKEWSGLWKPLFAKAKTMAERYDIQGSDVALLIAQLVKEAINLSVWREAYYGDKSVAASTSSAAGLKSAGNAKYFNSINGYWKQIFSSNDVVRVDISALQSSATVTGANAYSTLMNVYKAAAPEVRANKDAKFQVDGQLFLGYLEYLQANSIAFTLDYTQEGFQTVKFMGHDVVDMSAVFDKNQAYFELTSTGHAAYLPHRVIFAEPSNMHIATLDAEGIANLEVFYEQKERKVAIGAGYTIDAIMIDDAMVTVAY